MRPNNSDRNKRICKLLKSERLSYQLVADMIGVTRKVVAGVAFRDRHRGKMRCKSPSSGGCNKIGAGWRKRSYWPEMTAINTR